MIERKGETRKNLKLQTRKGILSDRMEKKLSEKEKGAGEEPVEKLEKEETEEIE